MRLYENRSTLMTSNRPIEEWGKLLCDVTDANEQERAQEGELVEAVQK